MEANELRIGNKLQKSNGEIFTISRLDESCDVLVKEQRCLLTLGYNLTGILLTEEILLKCGFKVLKHEFDSTFLSINILETTVYLRPSYLDGFYWGFVVDKLECEINDCKRIEYLHQLQNLYFILSGQELEINL